MSKSEEYWSKRIGDVTNAQFLKSDEYLKVMQQEYQKTFGAVEKNINAWYQRLATNNIVTLSEAKRLLSTNELRDFHMDLKRYQQLAEANPLTQQWSKQLENASSKFHINQFEWLNMQNRHEVEMLAAIRQQGARKLLTDGVYKDGYYQYMYTLQQGMGWGKSFLKPDVRAIELVMNRPWAADGLNFSQRIWKDKEQLVNELQNSLYQHFGRGESTHTIIKNISKKFNVSEYHARRLIETEVAFFSEEAKAQAFEEYGVGKYKLNAVMDSRTTPFCREIDGKVFLLTKKQVGVNYPPFHPHCRTRSEPIFEDGFTLQQLSIDNMPVRQKAPQPTVQEDTSTIIRTPTNETIIVNQDKNELTVIDITQKESLIIHNNKKIYPVPKTMGYTEWYSSFVEEKAPHYFVRKYNPKASFYAELPNVSEEVLEKIAVINRDIAKQGYKQEREFTAIADSTEGEELIRVAGDVKKVVFTQELHDILLDAPENSIILTHNHPRGTRINLKDIRNFSFYPSISHIMVITHDGANSYVYNNGKYIDELILKHITRQIVDTYHIPLLKTKKYAKMSATARLEYWEYVMLTELCKELGWVYGEDYSGAKEDPRFP